MLGRNRSFSLCDRVEAISQNAKIAISQQVVLISLLTWTDVIDLNIRLNWFTCSNLPTLHQCRIVCGVGFQRVKLLSVLTLMLQIACCQHLLYFRTDSMSYSFVDEPEGDGHRFVRQARTNMRAPAVKATGKIISSFVYSFLCYPIQRGNETHY